MGESRGNVGVETGSLVSRYNFFVQDRFVTDIIIIIIRPRSVRDREAS